MNWLMILRYIVARTREPSIVHRGVAAAGGLVASFSLSGPEKWVALIVSGSALIGILLPDSVPAPSTGFNDASLQPVPPPAAPNALPPVDLVGRSVPVAPDGTAGREGAGVHPPGADRVHSSGTADRVCLPADSGPESRPGWNS